MSASDDLNARMYAATAPHLCSACYDGQPTGVRAIAARLRWTPEQWAEWARAVTLDRLGPHPLLPLTDLVLCRRCSTTFAVTYGVVDCVRVREGSYVG